MNKRIITTIVFLLALISQVSAEDKVTINNFTISAGETKTMSITLEGEVIYAGFQFDMYLPDGIAMDEYNADDTMIPEGTSLTMTNLEDGGYRFLAAAMSLEDFKGSSGRIITIKVTASKNLSIGNLTGYFKDVKLSKVDGTGAKYAEMSFPITILAPSIVTAKSYERTYGEANPEFGYEVEGGELDGIPEFSCDATATSPVGTYDIIVKRGTETNYNVTYVKGTLTIKKAPLKIKAGTYTRKQGEENPEFTLTYEGFKNNETEAVLTKKPTATTTATKESAVGDYTVTVSGAEAQNYEISYENGTLKVTDADAVVVTAKSYTRVYGEENPAFEYTSSGAELVGVPEITCEATTTSPVGTYDIIIKKGSVTNYNDSYINGTLTITKAPLKIKAGTYTRKQGEENPEFTLTYEGFKNNETETVLTKKPTATTTATKESAVGDYTVTVSGAEATNYEITYENGTLKVTDADAVVVTAKSYTRVYGEDNPTFEYTTSGAALVGVPEITCEATATSPVGTYDIIIKKGSVTNYNDSYIKGTLTITRAPLKIKAGTYTRKQGEENPEFTLEYEGFKNNETKDNLIKQPTATTTATKASAVGDYTVTVSGAEAQNYEISYVNGILTVTAVLKGDANDDGKVDEKDIVDIANYTMGKSTSTGKFNEMAADMNEDGVVNIADVVQIVKVIVK